MNIGIFDSGSGGKFIADYLKNKQPHHNYIVVDDRDNVPYGQKTQSEIIKLTKAAIQPLLASCPIIIIACNTATAAAIDNLRASYPSTKFVGVEPMIKPAALQSKARHITVLATPYTLDSHRYLGLKNLYSQGIKADEVDTTGWAKMIDDGLESEIDLSAVDTSIASGSDSIVLACTHYIGLQDLLQQRYPETTILEPSEAIARQVNRLIA